MASVILDIYVHRRGVPANVTVRILDSRGNSYSREYASNGLATVAVPKNEKYQIILDPYNYFFHS